MKYRSDPAWWTRFRGPVGAGALMLVAPAHFDDEAGEEPGADQAGSLERDWRRCRHLNFDPLGHTVSACTRLIESREFGPKAIIGVLSLRGEAYIFGMTCKSDKAVTDAELWRRVPGRDAERDVMLAGIWTLLTRSRSPDPGD